MSRATRSDVLIRLLDRVWPEHAVEKLGQEHMVQCPFCASSKSKLAVNPEKGVFQCWVCGERGPVSKLLNHLQTLKVIKIADIKAVTSGGVISRLGDAIGVYKQEITKPKPLWSTTVPCVYPPHVYSLHTFNPKHVIESRVKRAVLSYLESRGVIEKDIERYRLSFCCNMDSIYHGHIFIPVLGPHGRQLIFWTTRAISNHMEPKSLHAGSKYSRFSAKCVLMNEHFIRGNKVAICEGPFDAFSIMQATGIPAVPLLGKVLHAYHKEVFRERGVKEIYICLDPDAQAQAEGLWNELSLYYDVHIVDLEDGDPNDVSHETLRAAFEKTAPKEDSYKAVTKHF